MQFDPLNVMGFCLLAYVAFLLHRHYRGDTTGEEDDVAGGQRRDVLQAIKSMRKDD